MQERAVCSKSKHFHPSCITECRLTLNEEREYTVSWLYYAVSCLYTTLYRVCTTLYHACRPYYIVSCLHFTIPLLHHTTCTHILHCRALSCMYCTISCLNYAGLSQFVIFLQDLVIKLNYFKSVLVHSDLLLTY